MWGIASVQWGITSVLWRVFSTVGEYLQYSVGITSVQWGITSVLWRLLSTVEIKIWNITNFQKISKSFQSLFHFEIRSATSQDSGYKNLVLGKILLWIYDKLGFWKYFMKFFGNCGRICEQFMIEGQSRSTAILCSIQHLLRMNSNLVGIQSE